MADEKKEAPSPAGPPKEVSPGVNTGAVDPQGRVKQQDAAGNMLADEKDLKKNPAVKTESMTPPAAPAVHTNSRTNFNRQKFAELERQALEAEGLEGQRRLQARAQIRAQIRELRERENRSVQGADIRTPRGSILHAEEAISQRPEFHYRFININAPGKADNARAMGYEKVPESEGGKTLGDLALFRISMERRAQVVASQEHQTKERLRKVTEDLRGEVRDAAKFLRSKGVDIDEGRLGVFSDRAESED